MPTIAMLIPPPVPDVLVSFPAPYVLLVTLNRPRQLNALRSVHHAALDRLFQWYDAEPRLRCAVITGAGRAFCAGADLKEWNERNQQNQQSGGSSDTAPADTAWRAAGFGALSNRAGKKPVVAAVNGICLGGGMEMAVNCDLVVAAAHAIFGLPEVRRGVVAIAGALPRIAATLGRQRASEMALTGRTYGAAAMARWGVVNTVVPDGADVVAAAVAVAVEIAGNSPDAVVVSRAGVQQGLGGQEPRAATAALADGLYRQIEGGANMREGVQSFVEKRAAVWVDSKL